MSEFSAITDILVADLFVEATLLSAVPLILGALSGTATSFLQAIFQIQDQTLVYLAKISTVGAVLFFFGPIAFERLMESASDAFCYLERI